MKGFGGLKGEDGVPGQLGPKGISGHQGEKGEASRWQVPLNQIPHKLNLYYICIIQVKGV